jgi:hypothetical protein
LGVRTGGVGMKAWITFVFYRRDGILPSLIKYFTMGQFSHVGIRFEVNGKVSFIESLGGRFVPWGVNEYPSVYTNHAYALKDKSKIERIFFQVPTEVAEQILAHTRTRVGSIYGILDFLRHVIRFLPRGKGYTCSELAQEVYEMMTGHSVRNSISPTQLYNICRAYKLGQNEARSY